MHGCCALEQEKVPLLTTVHGVVDSGISEGTCVLFEPPYRLSGIACQFVQVAKGTSIHMMEQGLCTLVIPPDPMFTHFPRPLSERLK
jgi:hypothetical protein